MTYRVNISYEHKHRTDKKNNHRKSMKKKPVPMIKVKDYKPNTWISIKPGEDQDTATARFLQQREELLKSKSSFKRMAI